MSTFCKSAELDKICPSLDFSLTFFCVTIYSYKMSKKEKLLLKARRSPDGLHFQELETMLNGLGWIMDRQRGSHKVWISPGGTIVPLQSKSGKAKGYQVKQILLIIDGEK